MTLRDAWEDEAGNWIRWARKTGLDSYWRFRREAFLTSLPPAGRLTLGVGCGEGRVTRDLRDLGHRVVGVDQSPSRRRYADTIERGGLPMTFNSMHFTLEDCWRGPAGLRASS